MLPRVHKPIVVRRLATTDLEDFQAYRTDSEVAMYQDWLPMSDDEARSFLEDASSSPLLQPGHWTQLAIASAEDGHLLGDVGIFINDDQDQAEIGFSLGKPHQGRGVATCAALEAIKLVFESTPVHRIIGVTDARNVQSIRLLERIGMSLLRTEEATFRGELCTEHTYALERAHSDA